MGEDSRTFLHWPTTSAVLLDVPTLNDIYLGDPHEIEYVFEEMRRRSLSILENQGQNVLFLKRLTYGTRCPFWKSEEEQCGDPLSSQASCYNTGWIGGYTSPLNMKIVFPPADRVDVAYTQGVRTEFAPKAWTINTPKMVARDLIVDVFTGERYEVKNVVDTLFRGLPMIQEFEIHLLMQGTSTYVYNVPLPAPLP